MGDLNWDMLKLSAQVTSFNNPKYPEHATLIDVMLTNNSDRYKSDVFCSDLSDHCFISCVCSCVNHPVLSTHRRLLKNFNELAFHQQLAALKWDRISLIPDVKNSWTFI